jgi:hypothetical protein
VVEGSDKKDPGRYRQRKEPVVKDVLGAPPAWLVDSPDAKARKAWALFAKEVPWLNSSHRTLVELASRVRGRMIAGQEVGVQSLTLLRQCLSQMGATPADASKVTIPDGEEEDPDEALFSRE